MTAREMFEELGFKMWMSNNNVIAYRRNISLTCSKTITFDLDRKLVFSYNSDLEQVGINAKTHKAIQKQMEELGWI